jgi:phosphatidate cytidylyltransferase
MLECGTTNPEQARIAQVPSARFDPRRIYTVLLGVPLLYAAIRYLPPTAFIALAVLAGGIALMEFYRMMLAPPSDKILGAIGLFGFAVLTASAYRSEIVVPILLIALLVLISVPLATRIPLTQLVTQAALALFGILYLGLTLSYVVWTRLLPQGEWLIFVLLLLTWAADTGAYVVGTLCGRHPLAPRISPKKTIEGLAGGLFGAMMAAFVTRWWFMPDWSSVDCVLVPVLLTGAGLWGDLAESAIKRSAGVKDSGGVLPGHGGMLDRLDSLLFAAPAFYYYVTLIGRVGSPL